MKNKKFFLAGLAIFAFIACNNEIVNPLPDINSEIQAKGYLTVTLTDPPVTRTIGGTDAGTEEERAIKSLTVVFTDVNGVISSVINPTVSATGVSEKFQVALGEHYVYALVNNPIEFTGGNIDSIISVAAEVEALSGYKEGSFLMVNKCNSGSENAGVRTVIDDGNSINNPARVDIQVDRVACKIYHDKSTQLTDIEPLITATGNFINNVEVIGFAVLNVNKDFNLVQKWNKNNVGIDDLSEEVLSTPLYPGGEADLVADQYFRNIGYYTTMTKIDNTDEIISIAINSFGEGKDPFDNDTVYTTENRPTIFDTEGELTAGRGETTGVIFKIQAKKGESNSETFYRYKNVIHEDLEVIKTMPEFAGKEIESMEAPQLRTHGIQVYEDGIMYYTYFVRDPNVAHQYKGKNYYGVIRNSSYKLSIKSISSIGDDVPGGAVTDPGARGEPGNPLIDTKEAYIDVALIVNKWVLNTIEIDF